LLQDKASTVNTEISAVGQIQSLRRRWATRRTRCRRPRCGRRRPRASADPTVVTADTSGGTAAAGDYSVSVQQMAQGQTVTLASATTALSAGTLTIQLGTYSTDAATPPNTTFASQSGSPPVSITIGPGDTSLSSIRDKINAANAGVAASIITDANGSRLSLRSTTTGAANGFQITATEAADDGNPATGLSALNFDASTGSTTSQLTLNQFAVNAEATVNGISIESATNKLSNISDGLSLTLLKKSDTPIDVTVRPTPIRCRRRSPTS
jgi:flagellar hook-associated protein 2